VELGVQPRRAGRQERAEFGDQEFAAAEELGEDGRRVGELPRLGGLDVTVGGGDLGADGIRGRAEVTPVEGRVDPVRELG
jgi:hypothetical protein